MRLLAVALLAGCWTNAAPPLSNAGRPVVRRADPAIALPPPRVEPRRDVRCYDDRDPRTCFDVTPAVTGRRTRALLEQRRPRWGRWL